MSTQIALPKGFGPVASVFRSQQAGNDELGAGIASSYGIIGYRGKVWSTRYQGKETPLMREDGDGPRGSIEVVIIKASSAISKIFYANGYVDGANAAPDCWSADGVKPDGSVQNKQNPTCAGCPRNAWGSRITDAGKQGKACSDSRRVAVAPLNDLANELFGGPMLLRVPAASLKDLKSYGDTLNSYQYPYFAVATRISFDAKEAFPKFVFSAIRPLTEDEAHMVMELREDKRTATVLNEAIEIKASAEREQQEEAAASPFEQGFAPAAKPTAAQTAKPAPTAAPKAATVTAATPPSTATPKAAPKKAAPAPIVVPEVEDEDEQEEVATTGLGSFDDMLEDIL